MADTKLSALTELAATPATDDELYIRDVSELAAAEPKRITVANLMGGQVSHSLATAANDFLVASGAGVVVKKTLAETKTILAGLFPQYGIIIWTGTIANIPAGFVICDGNNSTPNLLARFIEGVATASTNPGTTGGGTSKTTAGHTHTVPHGLLGAAGTAVNIVYTDVVTTSSATDSIADIRPLYYDVAFIMKT